MELTKENFDDLFKTICEQFLPKDCGLSENGIYLHKYPPEPVDLLSPDDATLEVLNWLLKEIPKHFQKSLPLGKKYWNTGSYKGKHILERTDSGKYSTNGQFILAMLLLGYEMKAINPKLLDESASKRSINATFNSSSRNISKCLCMCGLQYTKHAKIQHVKSKRHQLIMNAKSLNSNDLGEKA